MIRAILIGLLLLLVARAFWRLVDGIIEAAGGLPDKKRERASAVKLVRDPVCGTYVQPRESLSLTVRGTTHYFCSERCQADYGKRASA